MNHRSNGSSYIPPPAKCVGSGGIDFICIDNSVGAVFGGFDMKYEYLDRPGIDKTGDSTGSNGGIAVDCLEYTGSAGKVMKCIADTGLDNTGSDDTAMEFTDGKNDDCGGVAMDCIDGNSVWLHMLSCFEPDRCQDPLCHAGKAVLGHRLGCQVGSASPVQIALCLVP